MLQIESVRLAVGEIAPIVVDLVVPPAPPVPPPPPLPPALKPPPAKPLIVAAPSPSPTPPIFVAPPPPPEPPAPEPVITLAPPAPPAPPPAAPPPEPRTIPATAVVAYNAFTRGNRVLNAKLDAFAFELLTFLSMGQSLRTGQGQKTANVRALRTAAA